MSFWGELFICPKWLNNKNEIYLISLSIFPFNKSYIRANKRIGPHSRDIIISIIVGTLLGDAYAELRNGSTRI